MTAMLTADWFALGKDTYYRKFEIYNMTWPNDMDLGLMVVCAAPYGGPIALIRDRKQFIKVQGQPKPVINIYTSSGKIISSIVWNSGTIIKLGWSNNEELVCVQDDGSVLLYDMFGTYEHTFSMGSEAKDTKVIDAKIFSSPNGTGIAVITSSYRVFIINNIKEPKIRKLPELPRGNFSPSSWLIVSEDRNTVAIITHEKDFFCLKQDDQLPMNRKPEFSYAYTGVVEMAVSANNRHIALFTDSGILWIGSSDLKTRYCEYDTEHLKRPLQLVWCGTEAVIGFWTNLMLIIGRNGDCVHYSYDYNIHLVPEIDGVRVLSGMCHEMIQKVPPVVQQIFRINSTDPGSYLLEASNQFQKRSHRADEYICLVKDQLHKAVRQCIDAAGFEFNTNTQKMLIRAAQFGKGFINGFNPEDYVKMCRLLRVLNAVRDNKVGIPLTFTQLQQLTETVLLDRLVARRHYFLAIEIAKYLKLPENRILAHWARHKVRLSQSDAESVSQEIHDKIGKNPKGLSYYYIANYAADQGRSELAIKLLNYEIHANKQVPLLLHLGESDMALHKAIESGDTDLVYTVINDLKPKRQLGDFQIFIRNFPVAHNLYKKYCQKQYKEALQGIFVQEDDFNSQAAYFIAESLDPKTTTKDAPLQSAVEAFRRAKNDLGRSLCEDTRKLYKHQRTFEEKFHRDFMGKSIHDTVKMLLQMQEMKLADRIKSEFKIPDRRYWWLRIECHSELSEWDELEKFSKARSPIGYEPFVDVCLKHENKFEAKKYLPRCREELKVKYYVKVELFEEAAQIAFEQKDLQGLYYVQRQCSQISPVAEKVRQYVLQINTKK